MGVTGFFMNHIFGLIEVGGRGGHASVGTFPPIKPDGPPVPGNSGTLLKRVQQHTAEHTNRFAEPGCWGGGVRPLSTPAESRHGTALRRTENLKKCYLAVSPA